jgi:hypothetical protein
MERRIIMKCPYCQKPFALIHAGQDESTDDVLQQVHESLDAAFTQHIADTCSRREVLAGAERQMKIDAAFQIIFGKGQIQGEA